MLSGAPAYMRTRALPRRRGQLECKCKGCAETGGVAFRLRAVAWQGPQDDAYNRPQRRRHLYGLRARLQHNDQPAWAVGALDQDFFDVGGAA